MKLIFLTFILTIGVVVSGQSKKFKRYADTAKITINPYLKEKEFKDFFSNTPEVNEVIDLEDINQDLLNATVFYTFNELRKKKHRKEIELSVELFEAVNIYGGYYRSSSFNSSDYNSKKSKKAINYINEKKDYHVHYIHTYLRRPSVFDKKMFRGYYHDKHEEEGDGYYYGEKPKKGDTVSEIEPIELFTYKTFANHLVKQFFSGANSRFSKNKAITLGACYVFVAQENKNKSYLPYARVLFVMGGKRTYLLTEE